MTSAPYFDAYTDRDLIGVFLTTLTKDRYVDSMVIPGNETRNPQIGIVYLG
ncbi:hypothetical protein ACDP95_05225 [Weissella confusa]